MARICKTDPLYFSYLELPISCFDSESENALRGAYFFPGANGSTGTLYVFSNWGKSTAKMHVLDSKILTKVLSLLFPLLF